MKKEKSNPFLIILLLIVCTCHCVAGQCLSLSTGRTMIPGLYAGLRYSHPSNSRVNLAGEVFMEQAQLPKISYRALGFSLMGEYINTREPLEAKFAFKAAFGATGQIESEPFVYKDWPLQKRLNYGTLSEISGLWNMTEAFSLSIFAQQKFLFNKLLGTTHFLIGLSLSYQLGL